MEPRKNLPTHQERRKLFRWWREFVSLILPYWTGPKKWTGAIFLAGVIASICGIVYCDVIQNRWYAEFYNLVGTSGSDAYFRALSRYGINMSVWTALARAGSYLRLRLKIHWRESMTQHFLDLWLKSHTHYGLSLKTENGIDNPDQRISEDILYFIDKSEGIIFGLIENVLRLASFIGVLWGLSGVFTLHVPAVGTLPIHGYLVWCSLGFSVLSCYAVYRIGRELVPLQYEQQRFEGDFRFNLARVREYSESIALSAGENTEIKRAHGLFEHIVSNYRGVIRKFLQIEIFRDIHNQGPWIFAMAVQAPRFLSGLAKIGDLAQTGSAFTRVENSVAFVVNSFRDLADWRSAAKRLADFEKAATRVSKVRVLHENDIKWTESNDRLSVDLQIRTPNGRTTLKTVQLSVSAGERVLLRGPSGIGKTTFFRTLAGIWPYSQGKVSMPHSGSVMFISQPIYLPRGTLRDAILYPHGPLEVSDSRLVELLEKLMLENLIPQLDFEGDWQRALSAGEKQKVAIARALIQNPKWLFLDEAISALDQKSAERVLSLLKSELQGSAVIGISHQPENFGFYQRVVELHGDDQMAPLRSSA